MTAQKVKEIETIEQQYGKELQVITQVDESTSVDEQVCQEYLKYIDKCPVADKTRDLLAMKANSPFRIDLDEYENKQVIVKQYYDLLDRNKQVTSSNKQSDKPVLQTAPIT